MHFFDNNDISGYICKQWNMNSSQSDSNNLTEKNSKSHATSDNHGHNFHAEGLHVNKYAREYDVCDISGS